MNNATIEPTTLRGITVVRYPNPLSSRRHAIEVAPGATLRLLTIVYCGQREWPQPTVAFVNGEAWKRKHWDEEIPDGALVEFRSLHRGGGGNSRDTGYAIGGLEIAAGAAMIAFSGGSLAVPGAMLIGGGLLTIYETSQQKRPQVPSYLSQESGSPTYDIANASNRKRIGEPIPVVYGTHLLLPDLIAEPYSQYLSDNEYVFFLVCLGQGEFDINENSLKFGQAPFKQLLGVTYQILKPGDTLNLPQFQDNVAQAAAINGQAITGPQILAVIGADPINIYFQGSGPSIYLVLEAYNLETYYPLAASGGDTIVVTGTAHNDGTYLVFQVVSGLFLTVQVPSAGTAEFLQCQIYMNERINFARPVTVTALNSSAKTIGNLSCPFVGAMPGDLLGIFTSTGSAALYHITAVSSDGSVVTVSDTIPNGTSSGLVFTISRPLGTGVGYATNGAVAIGATSIPLNVGAGTILAGGQIQFAGDTNVYTVTTGITAPGTIVVTPPLIDAVGDGVAVSIVPSGQILNAALPPTVFAATSNPLGNNAISSDGGAFDDVVVGDAVVISGSTSNNTATGFVTSSAEALGATSIPVLAGTGTIPAGAVVGFNGDPNNYTVVTGVTGTGTLVIASPGLLQAVATAVGVQVAYPITAISTDESTVTVACPIVDETSATTNLNANIAGWSGWFEVAGPGQNIQVLEADLIAEGGLGVAESGGGVGGITVQVIVEYQGLISGLGIGDQQTDYLLSDGSSPGANYLSNGTESIGSTSVPVNVGSGTILQGSILQIAGDPNSYVVTTGITAPGTIVIESPGLQQALASGVQVIFTPPILTFPILAGASQATAYRRSFPFNNTTGYQSVQMRFRRTTVPGYTLNTNILDNLTMGAVRGYCPNVATMHPTTGSYPGCTCLAVKALATAQLSGAQQGQINMLATRKLPIWNGTAWSAPTATTSIAWAMADMLRSGQAGYLTNYGARLNDAEIDLAGLLALDATWSGRGDAMCGVFDQTSTIWEQLVNVARAGRCQPVLSNGIVTFVRDDVAATRVAMFTAAQIKPNSLTIKYLMPQENDPDGTSVTYTDPNTWATDTLDLIDGSADLPTNPQQIALFGVTSPAQATREAIYLDRVRKYQRKTIEFVTEMDGHLVSVGDLITISHDVPGWGQSGEIVEITGTTFTTSDPLDWSAGGTFYVLFREQDGTVAGPFTVTAGGGAPNQFVCTASLGFTPSTDLSNGDRTTYVFGPSTAYTQDCKVLMVSPQDGTSVQITCTPYVPAVYTPATVNGYSVP